MTARDCQPQTRLQVVTTGVVFLISGLAVWAGARGWYSMRDAWPWWPLGFVVPAVFRLTAPPPQRSVVAAAAWLSLAAVLIAMNLGHIHLRLRDVVPLVLVGIGLHMLYRATQRSGDRS